MITLMTAITNVTIALKTRLFQTILLADRSQWVIHITRQTATYFIAVVILFVIAVLYGFLYIMVNYCKLTS